jgi:hypothetical protein
MFLFRSALTTPLVGLDTLFDANYVRISRIVCSQDTDMDVLQLAGHFDQLESQNYAAVYGSPAFGGKAGLCTCKNGYGG